MEHRDHPSVIAVVAVYLEPVWYLLLFSGAWGAAFGWRAGAFLMLTALGGRVTGHLVIGFTEYRLVMKRPWPKVLPLDDEDEW